MKMRIRAAILGSFCIVSWTAAGQISTTNLNGSSSGNLNAITTAVPFLTITPDAASAGMGDVGVATTPDANAIYWNAAKLAAVDKEFSASLSYVPWLRNLVPDINLSYITGYKKLDKLQTIGGSLRYFSLGQIQFTDQFGNETANFSPNEFALDVAYGRKLSDKIHGGLAIRYINSNLTGGFNVGGSESKTGQAVAADISFYYEDKNFEIFGKDAILALGANISNIGNKMSYTQSSRSDFIPINLRLGPRVTMDIDEYNKLTVALDINKLLVPTPPIYALDSSGQLIPEGSGFQILAGSDPNRAVASGIFGSFSDAPGVVELDDQGNIAYNDDGTVKIESGSAFKEELREFNISLGAEYWYDQQFAIRAGYFHEHATKGNRKYLSLGAGLRYNVFGLDFAYLIPTYFGSATTSQQSPLQNTLRFTLLFTIDEFSKAGGKAVEG